MQCWNSVPFERHNRRTSSFKVLAIGGIMAFYTPKFWHFGYRYWFSCVITYIGGKDVWSGLAAGRASGSVGSPCGSSFNMWLMPSLFRLPLCFVVFADILKPIMVQRSLHYLHYATDLPNRQKYLYTWVKREIHQHLEYISVPLNKPIGCGSLRLTSSRCLPLRLSFILSLDIFSDIFVLCSVLEFCLIYGPVFRFAGWRADKTLAADVLWITFQ